MKSFSYILLLNVGCLRSLHSQLWSKHSVCLLAESLCLLQVFQIWLRNLRPEVGQIFHPQGVGFLKKKLITYLDFFDTLLQINAKIING